jgi:hypothetical protein
MVKYLFVGEMHGTNECPEIFLELVKRRKITQIALEWPMAKQKEVNEYLSGKRTIAQLSLFQTNPDGRTSPAMRKLLVEAKKRKLRIHLFDPGVIEHRDGLMAENLKKIKGPVAILCGDIHASKREVRLPAIVRLVAKLMKNPQWSKPILPCASLLQKKDVFSYRIVKRTWKVPLEDDYDEHIVIEKFTKSR